MMNLRMLQDNIVYVIFSIPFLFFLLLPNTVIIPPYVSNTLLSSLGIILLFSISIVLFFFTPLFFASTILLTLYIFLLRYAKSNIETINVIPLPTENTDNFENENNVKTLEESIIMSVQLNPTIHSQY
jgi:hypothetical protein